MKNKISDNKYINSYWGHIHPEEVYRKMKRGLNPYILLEGYFYQYKEDTMTYFKYKEHVPATEISREEVMSLLGSYLRRIKIEKICLNIKN